ncbi:MAG: nuclear transport factor 2 family protein [Salinirussus sp.]
MDPTAADELIDAYFDSLDTTDYDTIVEIMADDIELVTGGGEVYRGIDDVGAYYRDVRGDRDSTHETNRRRYGDGFAVAEGDATLDDGDGLIESEFCDVFDFSDGKLARVAIYSRRS